MTRYAELNAPSVSGVLASGTIQFKPAKHSGLTSISLPQHLAIIEAVPRQDADGAAEAHLESVAEAIGESCL